jgi:hypothetical protein
VKIFANFRNEELDITVYSIERQKAFSSHWTLMISDSARTRDLQFTILFIINPSSSKRFFGEILSGFSVYCSLRSLKMESEFFFHQPEVCFLGADRFDFWYLQGYVTQAFLFILMLTRFFYTEHMD